MDNFLFTPIEEDSKSGSVNTQSEMGFPKTFHKQITGSFGPDTNNASEEEQK